MKDRLELSEYKNLVENHFTDEVASIFQRRIAPDMLPFGTQIAFTCNRPRNFEVRKCRLYSYVV